LSALAGEGEKEVQGGKRHCDSFFVVGVSIYRGLRNKKITRGKREKKVVQHAQTTTISYKKKTKNPRAREG